MDIRRVESLFDMAHLIHYTRADHFFQVIRSLSGNAPLEHKIMITFHHCLRPLAHSTRKTGKFSFYLVLTMTNNTSPHPAFLLSTESSGISVLQAIASVSDYNPLINSNGPGRMAEKVVHILVIYLTMVMPWAL